jgi:hypothetical protein
MRKPDRPVIRRAPRCLALSRVLSGLGSYRYGRRSAQQAGLYADQSILATMQTSGGPPEWLPWTPNNADWNPITHEVWIPSGIFLAYYSDIRIWYLAGFPAAGILAPIKQATPAVVAAQLSTGDLQGNVKQAKAGMAMLARFSATVLDDVNPAGEPSLGRTFFRGVDFWRWGT